MALETPALAACASAGEDATMSATTMTEPAVTLSWAAASNCAMVLSNLAVTVTTDVSLAPGFRGGGDGGRRGGGGGAVSYTHLRAHETLMNL
eukprot:2266333-Prymnesium_polylepis.1